jgi:flagellar biosynthesis protein FlhG
MLKTLHFTDPEKKVHLVVNMAMTEKEGRTTAEFLRKMASQFLRHDLHPLGCIQKDPDVPTAIRVQRAFLEEAPHCLASQGIQSLATRILNLEKDPAEDAGGAGSFWKRLAEYLKVGSK